MSYVIITGVPADIRTELCRLVLLSVGIKMSLWSQSPTPSLCEHTVRLPQHYLPTDMHEYIHGHSHSATHEIPRIVWNRKVDFRIHSSLPLIPIPSQMNPVHILTPYYITSQSCVSEILGSNFGPETVYPDYNSRVLPRSLQENSSTVPEIGHDHFHPNHHSSTILQYSAGTD
jgi:hypothetical protein